MNNALDASEFIFGDGFHAMYLQEAMNMLSDSYKRVCDETKYDDSYNENKLRDDLVRLRPPKRPGIQMTFGTESRNLDKDNVRIDITIITLEVLSRPEDDFEKRLTIECKIVGVDQYINRNGIISYVEGKYASQLPVAGMIGFVFDGTPESAKDKINEKLNVHATIKTIAYLDYYALNNNFSNSYKSTHERNNKLPPIDILHLLLGYSSTVDNKN